MSENLMDYADKQTLAKAGGGSGGGDDYIEANQGVQNAGKFMKVGNDGIVKPVAVEVWSGGNY